MPAIEIKNLHKSYNSSKIIKGINLSIYPGEIVSLVGPSGSGKSTLLRLISQIEPIDSGQILINGQDIHKENLGSIVGVVFQHFNLFPHLTVLDNITLAPQKVLKIPKKQANLEAKSLLKTVGLLQKMYAYPRQLSGGQQQRIAIIRALAMHPKILLFDEPTSALDPEMVEDIIDFIRSLTKTHEMTIIIVSHEIKFAKSISNRMLFMDSGKIIADDTPENIIHHSNNPRIQEFFH